MIDTMEEETSYLGDEQSTRIQYLMAGCTFKLGILRNPILFS